MRFLFAAIPEAGHVNPALPIVRALADAGHAVTFTTGPDLAAAVTAAGAGFVPLPEGAYWDPVAADRRYPHRRELTGVRRLRFGLVHGFCELAAAQARHLLALHAAEPVDALVVDSAVLGARFTTELGGPPVGVYSASVLPYRSRQVPPLGLALLPRPGLVGRARDRVLWAALWATVTRATAVALDGQRRQLGLRPVHRTVLDRPVDAGLVLELSPPGFDYPRPDLPPVVHFVGAPAPLPVPGWAPPPWWEELAGRRVVVVTQGSAMADPAELLRPALAGLSGLDVLVVAVTGGPDPAVLGPLPANARAGGYIPYGPLFARAAAVVTNGGFGGVQRAISSGVPLVVAGATGDRPEVANRVAWSGVGVNLRTGRPSPDAVRAAVQRVLADPSYAARARLLAESAAPALAAERAAALLAELAATGRPVLRAGTGRRGPTSRRAGGGAVSPR
ncbi:MAG TPA: glycosyltransferase [Mycobacteriales bacterium]|nr:glycosyltransferase [Mycobacteriales bacterium]